MLLNYTRLNNNRGWLRALIAAAVFLLVLMCFGTCCTAVQRIGTLTAGFAGLPRSYLGQSVCRNRGIACKNQGGARSQSAAAGSLGLSDKALTLR